MRNNTAGLVAAWLTHRQSHQLGEMK